MLYPPYINGTLPAFAGNVLKIPYTMNKSVSYDDIEGFQVKIFNIANDKVNILNLFSQNFNTINNSVIFSIENSDIEKLTVGEFYKVQLAYKDKNNIIGYFSTVGIIKYTSTNGIAQIKNLSGSYNFITGAMVGSYTPPADDPFEKEYSYSYTIKDENQIFYQELDKIHNSNLGYDELSYEKELQDNKIYTISYSVKTINGYEYYSPTYKIATMFIEGDFVAEFNCKNNQDEGYINVSLNKLYTGSLTNYQTFVIARSDETTNYAIWNVVYKFQEIGDFDSNYFLFKDFAIEQGIKYKYSIQKVNKYNVYSSRIKSNPVLADYEDLFLYDGERQLKVRFNPKVSSFKTVLFESKTDTMGSKYAWFFRNGQTAYKEIPISGLISYRLDDQFMFLTEKEIAESHQLAEDLSVYRERGYYEKIQRQDISLTGENFYTERYFKLKVLDWLNNGKPKVFKSPAEGNYIIRLINVSLAPNDTLGRMIHTFSATGYEIADYSYYSLRKLLNIYNYEEKMEEKNKILQIDLIDLNTQRDNAELIPFKDIQTFKIQDAYPGEVFIIDGQRVIIGPTGTYINDSNPCHTIQWEINSLPADESVNLGYLYYTYFTEQELIIDEDSVSEFDKIKKISLLKGGLKQIHLKCNGAIMNYEEEIIDQLISKEEKQQIFQIEYLELKRKQVIPIFKIANGKWYYSLEDAKEDKNVTTLTDIRDAFNYEVFFNPFDVSLTPVETVRQRSQYPYNIHETWNSFTDPVEDISYCLTINDDEKIFVQDNPVKISNLTDIQSLKLGNGLIMYCYYKYISPEYEEN